MQFYMFLRDRFIDYPPYIMGIFSLPVERICFGIGVLLLQNDYDLFICTTDSGILLLQVVLQTNRTTFAPDSTS
jgi:hypothetical protein